MSRTAKLAGSIVALVAFALGTTAFSSLPAAASARSVASAPAKGLLTATEAKQLGFAKRVSKPSTTNKTGVAKCTKGAQVAFSDTAGATGLISEVLICTSAKAATNVLKKAKASATTSPDMTPPASLGPSALELLLGGSTYGIYWQRGKILELTGLDTDVPASADSTTTTSTPQAPLTAPQQQTLSNAAVKQDAKVH